MDQECQQDGVEGIFALLSTLHKDFGPSPTLKTLKNHERIELSWANNVYNTEFSVETRLEHGFAIENTYFL